MLAGLTVTFTSKQMVRVKVKKKWKTRPGEVTQTVRVTDTDLLTWLNVLARAPLEQLTKSRGFKPRVPKQETFLTPYKVRTDATGYWEAVEPFRFGIANQPESYLLIGDTKVRKAAKNLYMSSTAAEERAKSTDAGELGDDERMGFSYPAFQEELDKYMTDRTLGDHQLATVLRGVAQGTGTLPGEPTARDKALLTTLAAALLIAEPARNPRAFVASLMMLDLIEAGATYGTGPAKTYQWGNALRHPHSDDTGDPPPRPQRGGAVVKDAQNRIIGSTLTNLTTRSLLTTGAGGKLPFAILGSGSSIFADKLDPAHWYIQQKEVTVLTRWLLERLTRVPNAITLHTKQIGGLTWGAYRRDGEGAAVVPENSIDYTQHKQAGAIAAHIKGLIKSRIDSLDLLLG